MSSLADRLYPARVIARSGLMGPLRPDKYLRIGAVARRQGVHALVGASLAAAALPRPARDHRRARRAHLARARAAHRRARRRAARRTSPEGNRRIGLLARNHRGFVESLVATGKLGASLVLLNTAFAGPQLVEVLGREQVDVLDLRPGVRRGAGL